MLTWAFTAQRCFCLFDLIIYVPVNNLSVTSGRGFLGWTSRLARIYVSCSRTQRSNAGEARTRGPSVSSQALYHWATALSAHRCHKIRNIVDWSMHVYSFQYEHAYANILYVYELWSLHVLVWIHWLIWAAASQTRIQKVSSEVVLLWQLLFL